MSEFGDSNEAVLGKIAAEGYDTAGDGDWIDVRKIIERRMIQILQTSYENKGFVGPLPQSFESRSSDLITLLQKLGKSMIDFLLLNREIKLSFLPFQSDVAPFTTQRRCELLVLHGSQYSATHKLMNALERLLYVTSS